MRTNIEIDDELMAKAMQASTLETKTKKAVVEEALQLLVRIKEQEGIWKLAGTVEFDPVLHAEEHGVKNKWAEGETRYQEYLAEKDKSSRKAA